MDLKDLEKKVEEFVESLPRKKKECKDNGSHLSYTEFPYMVSNMSSPLRDKVLGFCRHCFTYKNRSLNQEEIYEINSFREDLDRPITI